MKVYNPYIEEHYAHQSHSRVVYSTREAAQQELDRMLEQEIKQLGYMSREDALKHIHEYNHVGITEIYVVDSPDEANEVCRQIFKRR